MMSSYFLKVTCVSPQSAMPEAEHRMQMDAWLADPSFNQASPEVQRHQGLRRSRGDKTGVGLAHVHLGAPHVAGPQPAGDLAEESHAWEPVVSEQALGQTVSRRWSRTFRGATRCGLFGALALGTAVAARDRYEMPPDALAVLHDVGFASPKGAPRGSVGRPFYMWRGCFAHRVCVANLRSLDGGRGRVGQGFRRQGLGRVGGGWG